MSKVNARNTHRTLAYFYVGLIISFSISGMILNHRSNWRPARYVSSSKEITIVPVMADSINEGFIEAFTKAQGIKDRMRRFRVEKDELRISYEKNDVELNITTGKGTIETYKKTPLISQMLNLHQDTSDWWIYYSDIFALAMLTIAITGMFIQKGKFGFKKHGWKLALIGIIFPLVFLFLLS